MVSAIQPATRSEIVQMKRSLLFGLALILVLLGYGTIRFPSAMTSPSGLIADYVLLIVYGLVIWFWFPALAKHGDQILRAGYRCGILIGVIFAGEMLLEYILLPNDNTQMGLVEYGSVLAIFFIASMWIAYQTENLRSGLFAAIVSAMLGSLLWLIATLTIFYLFHGSPQQLQVFRAEGNYYDFAQSGMTDFDAFIMQDFWGAGFFHSILLPLLAGILGSAGSLIGIFFVWLRKSIRQKTA